MLVVEPDKGEAPALPGVPVLGDVDIPHLPVLLEEVLKVALLRLVGEVVHLEGGHLAGVRGRASSAKARHGAAVSAGQKSSSLVEVN